MTQENTQATPAVSRLEAFADSVRDAVNAACGVGATVDFCPEMHSRDIIGMKVYVTPLDMSRSAETREEGIYDVTVGVIIVSPASTSAEVSALLAQVDAISKAIEADGIVSASLQRVTSGPPSGEAWLEDGVFLGTIEAEWKWWCRDA